MMLDDKGGKLEAELLADEGSDYVRLLKATTSKPSASVLAAIPTSMEYIMSMSVHGDLVVGLQHAHLAIGANDEAQCVETVAHGHAVLDLAQIGQFLLQERGVLAVQVSSALNHLAGSGLEFVDERGVRAC